ncbi:CbtA family protein [Nocardioides rubriscoriae]|uniref:CbtA family protein n=1 Tax=Nocardioides rubriscoriae TaxID=642762 RepID=UPI0011DF4C40|nr:CbtA family protein [Nocardioides rubriscoriae]
MTARAFLVRGLLVGLLAGLATFATAYVVGEPHVEAALQVEEAHAATETDEAGHHDDVAVVPRTQQRTLGLLTGSLSIATVLGGTVALVAAGTVGRVGRLSPRQSTGLVALIGFVAVALVPFLKYPASPPAVGSADTIGARTTDYFGFLLVSVVVAVLATGLALRLLDRHGAFTAGLAGVAAYVVAMVAVGSLMPAVDELGDFPADTLWYFRRASIATLTVMWAAIGIGLAGLVGRLHDRERAVVARRELAASL